MLYPHGGFGLFRLLGPLCRITLSLLSRGIKRTGRHRRPVRKRLLGRDGSVWLLRFLWSVLSEESADSAYELDLLSTIEGVDAELTL